MKEYGERGILGLIVVAEILIAIDFCLASLSLPSIARSFGVDGSLVQWIISGYSVTLGGFLIIGGRLSDLLGPKRCYMMGMAIVGAATVASGLSGSLWILIGVRALQGGGAAILLPATLALVNSSFPAGERRLKALNIIALGQGLSVPVGTILAGLMIARIGWRGAYFINVPLAVAALIAAPFFVPPSGRRARHPLDLVAAAMVTIGAALLVWSLSSVVKVGAKSPWTIAIALVASVLFLAQFYRLQQRARAPLLPPALLSLPGFIPGVAVQAILAVGSGGLITLTNMSLQQGLGITPLSTGFALIPYGLVAVSACALVPRIGKWLLLNARASVVWALLLMAVSHLWLSFVSPYVGPILGFLPAFILVPIGSAVGMTVGIGEAFKNVPPDQHGIASAVLYMVRMIGLAIGVSIMVSSVGSATQILSVAPLERFAPGYLVGVVICVFGAVLARMIFRGASGEETAAENSPILDLK